MIFDVNYCIAKLKITAMLNRFSNMVKRREDLFQ